MIAKSETNVANPKSAFGRIARPSLLRPSRVSITPQEAAQVTDENWGMQDTRKQVHIARR